MTTGLITNLASLISTLANCVIALATMAGVMIAGYGLSTWREQLKGTTEYDLVRRLLLEVYRVRDAVERLRDPLVFVREAGDAVEGIPWKVAAYTNRLTAVRDTMVGLRAVTLESEVNWGNEIVPLKNRLNALIVQLTSDTDIHIAAMQGLSFGSRYLEERRKTLIPSGDDNFGKEFNEAIGKFEEYVKPHLQR